MNTDPINTDTVNYLNAQNIANMFSGVLIIIALIACFGFFNVSTTLMNSSPAAVATAAAMREEAVATPTTPADPYAGMLSTLCIKRNEGAFQKVVNYIWLAAVCTIVATLIQIMLFTNEYSIEEFKEMGLKAIIFVIGIIIVTINLFLSVKILLAFTKPTTILAVNNSDCYIAFSETDVPSNLKYYVFSIFFTCFVLGANIVKTIKM